MKILPCLLKDGYKIGHIFQYPPGTEMVYSNLTPRNTRREGDATEIVFFGLQYFLIEYLQRQFQENFFAVPRADVVRAYKRRIDNYLGPGTDVGHIGELHDLVPAPSRQGPARGHPGALRRPGAHGAQHAPALLLAHEHAGDPPQLGPLEGVLAYRRVFEEFAQKTDVDRAPPPRPAPRRHLRRRDQSRGEILRHHTLAEIRARVKDAE